MEFWLNDDIDMTKIVDSMQLDSGTEIAGMKLDNITVSLEVRGEVRVWWNENGDPFDGDCYTTPSEFPRELKDLIAGDNRWWDCDKRVYIDNNNWFEVFTAVDDTYVPDADVVDVEGMTPVEIFTMLYDICKNAKEEYGNDK